MLTGRATRKLFASGSLSVALRNAAIITACAVSVLQFLIEILYVLGSAKKGVFPMNFYLYGPVVERRRHVQASLLPVFDEIAQACVKIAQGGRGTGNAFSSLQSYLDGTVTAGGVSCSRRSVVLAIHDMAQDREAPLALQRKALAQLIMLQMHPIPKLTLYRDIAMALLRMEVVMRQLAARAPVEQEREPILSSAGMLVWEDVQQRVHASVEAVSLGLAGVRAALPQLHAPNLSSLMLSGLRYLPNFNGASGHRAAIST